jgi:hypothetical protein
VLPGAEDCVELGVELVVEEGAEVPDWAGPWPEAGDEFEGLD